MHNFKCDLTHSSTPIVDVVYLQLQINLSKKFLNRLIVETWNLNNDKFQMKEIPRVINSIISISEFHI